ncbi:MAG TPA: GreA/GreB family elongation factor, partial [Polyangia bacterium]
MNSATPSATLTASASATSTTTPDIVLTRFDHHRLSRLVERLRREGRAIDSADALEEELERAVVVDPYKVPATVVTMNSEVEAVSLDNGQPLRLTIVFPAEADARAGRVSVLAPLGLALLGARVGDTIT